MRERASFFKSLQTWRWVKRMLAAPASGSWEKNQLEPGVVQRKARNLSHWLGPFRRRVVPNDRVNPVYGQAGRPLKCSVCSWSCWACQRTCRRWIRLVRESEALIGFRRVEGGAWHALPSNSKEVRAATMYTIKKPKTFFQLLFLRLLGYYVN